MPNYTATGAGDAAYNGTYTDQGDYGGYPHYTNGAKWIWGNGTTWYAATDLGNSPSPGYQKGTPGSTPPTVLWDSGNATEPPFTLAEAGAGRTPGRMIAAMLRGF